MSGDQIARAALALTGVRFRLHGRDPISGLDCLGLVGCALKAAGLRPVLPRSSALRQRIGVERYFHFASDSGLAEIKGPVLAGDIILFALTGAQHHLAVATGLDGIVHAHAGLRRVVYGPPGSDWRILRVWRSTNS